MPHFQLAQMTTFEAKSCTALTGTDGTNRTGPGLIVSLSHAAVTEDVAQEYNLLLRLARKSLHVICSWVTYAIEK